MLAKPKKIRQVYLDSAATTQTDPAVLAVMRPFLGSKYGNPSSLYKKGVEAKKAIEDSRKKIAGIMRALPDNIIFTSGGTESNNLAIYGIAKAHSDHGKHIVSVGIEHHAVLKPLQDLKKQGWKITFVEVDKTGMVDPKKVLQAISKDTVLVTIMYANNEIGTIEPIADIGRKILRYRKQKNSLYPYFHTDACQAASYLSLDIEKLHVDLLSLNGSKIYGPKGIGVLYLRRGVEIKPLLLGGEQEDGLRAGTENVAGIIGLSKALELAQKSKDKENLRLQKLTSYFWQQIHKKIPNVYLNGPEMGGSRLVNNLNVTFAGLEGEALLLYLDEYGIMCSAGSACTTGNTEVSHVLRGIGLSEEEAKASLRFSLGKKTSRQDVVYVMLHLPELVEQLRKTFKMK